MTKRKVPKKQIQKERNPKKLRKVLNSKGYKGGKTPRDKVAHHVKPVAEGGKTTKKNIRVVSRKKHLQIHKRRRERGKI